jgi:hypothetical protein
VTAPNTFSTPTTISEENSLLTHEEWDVYSDLSSAWNKFIKLPEYFGKDTPDFAFHINALKGIVMSRPVEREIAGQNPNYFDPDSV